jgi:hypothetical protein
MKTYHVISVDPVLFESIDKENNTEYFTEDLVKLAKANDNPNWTAPMGINEALAYLKTIKPL